MVDPAQEPTASAPQHKPVFGGGAVKDFTGQSQQPQQQQQNQQPQPPVLPRTQSDEMNFGGRGNQTPQQQEPQQPRQQTGQQAQQQQAGTGQTTPNQQRRQEELTPPNQQARQQQQQYDPYNDPYYQDYPVGPMQEELVYEWKAPSRPFKQHNRQYYTTVGTIVLLVALILFFAGQLLPIAVVLAVGFLVYVMTSIPPHTILNQITTYGIRTADNLYYWDELGRFWFKKKYDDEIMHVEVGRFPDRLTLLVGEGDKKLLQEIMSLTLLEEEPPATYYERAAAWLQEKIPLDIEA